MEKGAYGLGLGLRVSGLGFLSLQGICFRVWQKRGPDSGFGLVIRFKFKGSAIKPKAFMIEDLQ